MLEERAYANDRHPLVGLCVMFSSLFSIPTIGTRCHRPPCLCLRAVPGYAGLELMTGTTPIEEVMQGLNTLVKMGKGEWRSFPFRTESNPTLGLGSG